VPKNRKDDQPRTAGRRPRLTATARAQAQRDALSRRVTTRATHLLRYGTLKPGDVPSWENFPWGNFFQECNRNPIRGVNRVTGLPHTR
jgi:hypothetical protein